ncbi:hypothetical protein VNO77_29601 [Canavalia gladiata]|uniref:Uncharacterized protein n=1 Tax=Canavalia gladiata TaxID=3824 RepID=A0AAN9KR06_CANGL
MNIQLQSKIQANPKISSSNPVPGAHKVEEAEEHGVVSASLTSEQAKEASRVEQYQRVAIIFIHTIAVLI